MSDRIEVRGLRVLGSHGANPGEQDRPQPFELDLVIEADLARAVERDDLAETVNYGSAARLAAEIVSTTHFQLLEALAGAIGRAILDASSATAVTVSLRKLRPPIPLDLSSVGVEITSRRDGVPADDPGAGGRAP